jgi:hypothetical protein
MKVEEFEDHLGRFGEDLMVWPPSAREAGLELLRNSAEARQIMEEAQVLRRAMTAVAPVRAPAGLADRIVAEALRARPVAHDPAAHEPLAQGPLAQATLAQATLAQAPLVHEPLAHEPIARDPLKQGLRG